MAAAERRGCRRRSHQLAIVVGALVGVREGAVGGLDTHEFFRGCADVRVAFQREPAIRRLDLPPASPGGDAEDLVERGGEFWGRVGDARGTEDSGDGWRPWGEDGSGDLAGRRGDAGAEELGRR